MFKNVQVFASILICVLAVTMFSPITASAGASKITIDNTSFQESIDGTTWNNPSGDVQVKNQTLLFEENSTRYTRLITKTVFNVYEYSDEIVSADYEVEFEKIPEGQSFILAFGLSSIEGVSGEEGNLEIAITNHSGLKISISEYQKSNEPVTLMNEKKIGTKSKISVTIYKDKQLILTVNGEKIYHGAIGVAGVGRAGFLQTGKCKVTITNVNIASERYDHPENCDVYETFDNGKMNTNALTSCMFSTVNYAPSVCEIQEYNGDYVLMFKNCGTSYISTKYQYSNFEMTFDVPYLGRKAVYSETDSDVVVEPKNSYLGISVGDSYLETNYEAFQTSYEMFVMADSNIYAWKDGYKLAGKADENHLVYDRNESRGFSLKITCIDGEFQFAVKWMEEHEFTPMGTYQTPDGSTPLGYIHLWVAAPGNIAIDNLKIVNLDRDAKKITVDYKESEVQVPEDYDYKKEPMVYKEVNEGNKGFDRLSVLVVCTFAGIAVMAILISYAYYVTKKRRAAGNEKQKN